MLTNHPPCPICSEAALYRLPSGALHCAECGYDSGGNKLSEEKTPYTAIDNACTIRDAPYVNVPRAELEQEHTHLMGRLQQLRRLLGYTPLPTGKQLRREQQIRR
jgi:hypothetical protein